MVIQGLLDKTTKLFFSKSKLTKEKLEEVKPLSSNEVIEVLPIPENQNYSVELVSLDDIREERQRQLNQQYTEKLNTAIRYTQETFAPFVSDADMNLLCKNLEIYASGNDLEDMDIKPVKVKGLTTVDICHFGWNIWNHLEVTDQWKISNFLKFVFKEKQFFNK